MRTHRDEHVTSVTFSIVVSGGVVSRDEEASFLKIASRTVAVRRMAALGGVSGRCSPIKNTKKSYKNH